jgi:hypothetical protein
VPVRAKRTIAIGGLAASLVGGGAAVAARGGDEDKPEQAILSDAAKRLGVSTHELQDALAKAEDAQLEKAVKDGDLTKEQADAIKRHRRESGHVLGIPGGPPAFGFGFRAHGPFMFGGPGELLDALADELGISTKELFSELRDGKTLEEVAKAHDKTLDDLKSAAKQAVEKRLDKAVDEGDLTRKQADEILERVPDLVDHLAVRPPDGRRRFFRPPHMGPDHFGPPSFGPREVPPPPRWQ